MRCKQWYQVASCNMKMLTNHNSWGEKKKEKKKEKAKQEGGFPGSPMLLAHLIFSF